jgi:hypothetical protein
LGTNQNSIREQHRPANDSITYACRVFEKIKRLDSCTSNTGKSSLAISAKPVGVGGCVSAIDSNGRTIFIADAHRDDGKRFVVHADEGLTAFLELEWAIRAVTS